MTLWAAGYAGGMEALVFLLLLAALGCAGIATAIGFQWVSSDLWAGWFAAALTLLILVKLVAEPRPRALRPRQPTSS